MQTRKLRKFQVVEAACTEFVSEGLGLSFIKTEPDAYKPLTGFVWGVLPGERFLARVVNVRSNHFHAVLLTQKEFKELETQNAELGTFSVIGKTDAGLTGSVKFTHSNWALLETSPERVEPPCPNFIQCGGCKMMHMEYGQTVNAKAGWFDTQLQRNKIEYGKPSLPVAAKNPYYYRNHVQIHINKFKERGFYAPGTYRTIAFPEKGCLIFRQDLVDSNFPQKLELERCVRARIDAITHKTLICSLNSKQDKNRNFTYTIAYPDDTALNSITNLADLPGHEFHNGVESPNKPEEPGLTEITLSNTGFFQVNSAFLPEWLGRLNHLFDAALVDNNTAFDEKRPLRVLELFSGFGFITKMLSYTRPLVSLGVDIISKNEVQKTIVNNSVLGPPRNANFNDTYIQQDLNSLDKASPEDIEAMRNFKPDLLMINPPRGGFVPQQLSFLMKNILGELPPVVFSSCNGATLARDIAYLQTLGYKLENVSVLDFFPWTSHYEIICNLRIPE